MSTYTHRSLWILIFQIRDMKDYPVLYTAIIEDVDVLITGDKDFSDIELDRPKIMTPGEFTEKFCSKQLNTLSISRKSCWQGTRKSLEITADTRVCEWSGFDGTEIASSGGLR